MNLIDRDKLIEDLKHFFWTAYQPLSAHPCEWSDVIRIINKQENANEWIPVSERLPEEKLVVLTAVRTERGEIDYVADMRYKGEWSVRFESKGNWEVIAWKPIEPYTGDKEQI